MASTVSTISSNNLVLLHSYCGSYFYNCHTPCLRSVSSGYVSGVLAWYRGCLTFWLVKQPPMDQSKSGHAIIMARQSHDQMIQNSVVFNHDFKYKFDMLQFTYQLLLDNGSPRLSDVHTQNLRVYYTILLLCSFVLTASYKGDSFLMLTKLFKFKGLNVIYVSYLHS